MFDDAEYGDGAEDQGGETQERSLSPEQAAAIVQRLDPEAQVSSANDDYMNEVDRRLEVASYYRELLRSPLFDNESPAAEIVQNEMRTFATGRLEVLLAIKQERFTPPPESQFSPDEVQALKAILRELIKHPNVLKAKPGAGTDSKPVVPSLRRAAAPEERNVRPQISTTSPVEVGRTNIPAAKVPPPQKTVRRGTPVPPARTGKPTTLKKKVQGNDGEEHEIEVPRVQRPEGSVPFPADMSVHTMASSASSVQAAGRGAAALATIASKINTKSE